MKEQYIEADMDIIVLSCEDVITTSSAAPSTTESEYPTDGWV